MFGKDRRKGKRKTALKRKEIAMIRDKFFATKQKNLVEFRHSSQADSKLNHGSGKCK